MSEKNNEQKKENRTGKYVYDKKLKKVVKVNDEIVGVKKSGSDFSGPSCPSGGCCPNCGM
jgi:hypothetical protein